MKKVIFAILALVFCVSTFAGAKTPAADPLGKVDFYDAVLAAHGPGVEEVERIDETIINCPEYRQCVADCLWSGELLQVSIAECYHLYEKCQAN